MLMVALLCELHLSVWLFMSVFVGTWMFQCSRTLYYCALGEISSSSPSTSIKPLLPPDVIGMCVRHLPCYRG